MPRNKIPGQDYGDKVASGEIATTRYGNQRQAEPANSDEDEPGHRRAAAENAMYRAQEAHKLDSYEVDAKASDMWPDTEFQVRAKNKKPKR